MPPTSAMLVQESLLHVKIDDGFIQRFYSRFFAKYPQMLPLFSGSMEDHTHKFRAAFEMFSRGAGNLENMKPALTNLGAYHAGKNVRPEYFAFFEDAILETMAEELGDIFTPEMRGAWQDYLRKISGYMKDGIESIGGDKAYTHESNDSSIIAEFEAAGAILSGHFILSSGLHSSKYLQCARVMMDAARGERLCAALAAKLRRFTLSSGIAFDAIVAPAMGGVVVGYEMGRQLSIDTMFCERVEGKFTLRRGFELKEGQKILIVEDVVTTGKSSMEAVACVESYGAKAVAACSLIDRRSGNDTSLTLPLISLLKLEVPTYAPDALPDELKSIPAIKPGSRDLKTGK